MTEVCFELPAVAPGCVRRLSQTLGIHRITAQALARRGLVDPDRAAHFLTAEEVHPPTAFAGWREVVGTVERHLAAGSPIVVHGDYDVDGVCGTAILLRVLRARGGNVRHYIPHRAAEGYGLSLETVERLARNGAGLLITVDCGIKATAEVERARQLGVEVVVTDHHQPPAQPPPAPTLHPRLCSYPFPDLCGAAVAHKLAQLLAASAGARLEQLVAEDLDLVALATVADAVPLLGENRSLVKRGLRTLRTTAKPGLRALLAASGVEAAKATERDLAFSLAPRLNAPGRLLRADASLELLLCEDPQRAREVAAELQRANELRRRLERQILSQAEGQVRALGPRPAYVLAGERWHPGVVGIVASRLVEAYNRPFALVALEGERGRGSARSVEGFDLVAALRACSPHLRRYGGHRLAAGFEVERAELQRFGSRFIATAQEGCRSLPGRRVRVDARARVGELDAALAEELALLSPFGHGNPPIALLLEGVRAEGVSELSGGRHLRFAVREGEQRLAGIAFGVGRIPGRRLLALGEPIDAACVLELNEWRGAIEPRLRLLAARAAAAGGEPRLAYPVGDGRGTGKTAA